MNCYFQSEKPLIHLFLGKTVIVDIHGYSIPGRLVDYQLSEKEKPHRPSILIVETIHEKLIVRGNWNAVKTVKGAS